jgi:N-acetyl-anhydromuramyl-L-alanine amidase AmpD
LGGSKNDEEKMKNITIVLAAIAILALVSYFAWKYFFLQNDADEGGFSLTPNPKKDMEQPQEEMVAQDRKIENITAKLAKGANAYPTRKLSQIQQVVLHHSATASTAKGSNPYAYAQFHVNERGWSGIGYHYVIQPDGKIFQTNELATVSNHVQNANTRSIGVCLSGNFDNEKPTQDAIASLLWLLRHLQQNLGRQLPVREHNDFTKGKSCPGAGVSAAFIQNWAYGYA